MYLNRSEFIVILSRISSSELKEFRKHLKKNFRQDSLPFRLFQYLRKFYPKFDHPKVNYQMAFTALYPGRQFKIATVQNTLSDLLILLREFLQQQYLTRHPYEKDLVWLKSCQYFGLKHQAGLQLRRMKKTLEKSNSKDNWYYLEKMRLEHERYYNLEIQQIYNRKHLYEAHQQLDNFYLATKLKYIAEIYNGVHSLNEDVPEIFLEDAVLHAASNESCSLQTSFARVVRLLRDQHELSFYLLKDWFVNHHQEFTFDDQFIILNYLNNFASRQIEKGHSEFVREAFELVTFGIENNIFMVKNRLLPVHFLNTLELAGKLKEFDWANVFIEQHKNNLQTQSPGYYYTYAKARLAFRRNKFNDCIDLLEGVQLKTPQHKILSRWLLVMALYEINTDPDVLFDKILALERSVRNNKLMSTKNKQRLKSTIKVLRILLHPEPNKNKLKQLVDTENALLFRSWLEEKIALLK